MRGVVEHRVRIDELISTYATGWSLERMPAVDRNVLRLGVWELLYGRRRPRRRGRQRGLSLVRDLSTDESPAFVNGILGAVSRDRARLTA